MYFILGISLVFAFFYFIYAAATMSVVGVWHVVAKHIQPTWSARRRANFIFALRVFPFVSALFLVSFFLIPAYIIFEPRSTKETVGIMQACVSLVSVAGILTAVYRLLRTRRATRKLVCNWLRDAEPIAIDGVSVPVYRICHAFPIIAVVGIFRPQMFVARQIFESLTYEEFQAAIAHEAGHITSRDNFKRTLLGVCRDLLVFPVGRALDRDWATSAETSADEYAALNGGRLTAINLAAALVKIARIVPSGAKPSMPAGAYLVEAQPAAVAFRVERLLKTTERDYAPAKQGKIAFRLYSGLSLAILLLFATNRDFLRKIHDAVEVVIALQQ